MPRYRPRNVLRGNAQLTGVVSYAPVLPAYIQALDVMEWGEIPNSNLSSTASLDPPYSKAELGRVHAWQGAGYNPTTNEYGMAANGGHTDSYNNGIYTYNCITASGWVTRRTHSLEADCIDDASVFLDGRCSAKHTYYGTQFDQVNNRILIFNNGGSFDSAAPPAASDYTYRYRGVTTQDTARVLCAADLTANDWLDPETLSLIPVFTGTSDLCCTNYITNETFYNKSQEGSLRKYAHATDTWSVVGAWYMDGGKRAGAIDPTRNRMFVTGRTTSNQFAQVRNTLTGAAVAVTFGGLGGEVLRDDDYPGAVYDYTNDCFWMVINSDPLTIYKIDAATYEVTEPAFTGTMPAQRGPSSGIGIHNSVHYAPDLRSLIILNSWTGNMKVARTAA